MALPRASSRYILVTLLTLYRAVKQREHLHLLWATAAFWCVSHTLVGQKVGNARALPHTRLSEHDAVILEEGTCTWSPKTPLPPPYTSLYTVRIITLLSSSSTLTMYTP